MFFSAHWVTDVPQPVDQIADRIRRLIISEKYFSDQRGRLVVHGVVFSDHFTLVPCIVELVSGSIKPYPVRVQGRLSTTEQGTWLEADAQMTDIYYVAFGLLLLTCVAMFVYASVIAPGLLLAWAAMFIPSAVFTLGLAILYARVRLRLTMRALQEGVLKP
jgi:hypothetical protein